jgi:hypothetical protein
MLLLIFSGGYGTFTWLGPIPRREVRIEPEFRRIYVT